MKILNDPKKVSRTVRELLESFYWLPGLKPNERYARLHDDYDGTRDGYLSVVIGEDGDAWIDPVNESGGGLRFRMPFTGGGSSPRVRAALVILAEAIRLDNEENPLQSAHEVFASNEAALGRIANSLGFVSPHDAAVRWVCRACNTANPIDAQTCSACQKDKPT